MASCDLWNMNVTGLFISNGMVNEKHYLQMPHQLMLQI